MVGNSGAIYLGVNLEFTGMPLNASVHGEQFANANARGHGETGIVAIALSAPPCGHCRQFLNELAERESLQFIIEDSPPQTLSNLLPQAFGPNNLGLEGGLMMPQCVDKIFTCEYSTRNQAFFTAYNSYAL